MTTTQTLTDPALWQAFTEGILSGAFFAYGFGLLIGLFFAPRRPPKRLRKARRH